MTVTFADPICQYPGCSNPTEAYVNVTSAMASSVPSRFEARCGQHGGVPVVWAPVPTPRGQPLPYAFGPEDDPSDEVLHEQVVELGLQLATALKVVEAARALTHNPGGAGAYVRAFDALEASVVVWEAGPA